MTDTHYRVKRAAHAGATIRSAPRANAAVLGRLAPGDSFTGEAVPGQQYSVAGLGSTNLWVRSMDLKFVWLGMLERVRE